MDVLLHQNAIKNNPNILVINGVVETYSGTQQQQKAVDAINHITELQNKLSIPLLFRHLPHARTFQLFLEKGKVGLISNYLNKDDAGRTISFSFYSDCRDNPRRTRMMLQDYCTLVGMKLTPGDAELFEKCLSYYKGLKKYIGFAITIAGLIGIILLCNR